MEAGGRATLALRVACSGPVSPQTLRALDALLATHPDALDLRFARACLLEELGRLAAARRAYAELLERAPAHVGALTNLAVLAHVDGRLTTALRLYERAAAAAPDDPATQINLAHALADRGERRAASAAYERALDRAPDHPVAHYALAELLAADDPAAAAAHRARAFAAPILATAPARAAEPLRVLVLAAADGGNLVSTLFFDPADVEATTLIADSWSGGALPRHDAIVNAVADADRSARALAIVERIVAASGRPCVNAPAAVRATGRVAIAARLGTLPGVVTPLTRAFARGALTAAALHAAGFAFPLLVRAPGYHAGRHFVRVATPDELEPQIDALPGDELLAIAYVETRDAAGAYRKYRMLIVDGALYPLHLAFARRWNVHAFSADNAVRAECRAAEAAFLHDPRSALGERTYRALAAIRDALGLDYGGIDFALDAAGNVVVFEANATFAIYYPDDDATATARGPAVDAAVRAVRAMVRERALRGRAAMREDRPLDHGEDLRPA